MDNSTIDELARRIAELTGSSGVTRRCVSLAQGKLSPDQRVNYEFGLVLGVDEFEQEQYYFLNKEYLHNRALHGYGTVSGLRVLLDPEDGGDVQLTVAPGMGIDQCGRVFVVRNEQCAFLKAWLQRQADSADVTVAEQASTPGLKRLYVVATYDECPDALVAIAGQPCSTGEQSTAASRIRDSFQIDLRWQPPAMPAWDSILCFAELMADVRIEPEMPVSDSDKDEIIELVRLLDDCDAVRARRLSEIGESPLSSPVEPGQATLYLTGPDAHTDLDDVMRIWVTEVRPRLVPDILGCDIDGQTTETGVLLAQFDFVITDESTPGNPVIDLVSDTTDDSGRPYLLSTQVIQELMTLGGGDADVLPQREFATLHVHDNRSLLLWVHHPEPIIFPTDLDESMEVRSNNVRLAGTVEAVEDFDNVFLINVDQDIPAGARIEVRLFLNVLRVGMGGGGTESGPILTPRPIPGDVIDIPGRIDLPGLTPTIPGPTLGSATPGLRAGGGASAAMRSILDARRISGSTALLASIDLFHVEYTGRDGDVIVLYTIASELPEVRDFATMSTIFLSNQLQVEMWFHAEEPFVLSPAAVEARIDPPSDPVEVALTAVGANPNGSSSIWRLRLAGSARFSNGQRVSLRFDTDRIILGSGRTARSLTTAMQQGQYAFAGFDGDHEIEVFHHLVTPAEPPESQPGLTEDDVIAIIEQVRTLPFVTITPLGTNGEQTTYELWFHTARLINQGGSAISKLDFHVYFETLQDDMIPAAVDALSQLGPNHWQVALNTTGLLEAKAPPDYARFVFPLRGGTTIQTQDGDQMTLQDYIVKQNVKLDGYYVIDEKEGDVSLVVYSRFLSLNRVDEGGGRPGGPIDPGPSDPPDPRVPPIVTRPPGGGVVRG